MPYKIVFVGETEQKKEWVTEIIEKFVSLNKPVNKSLSFYKTEIDFKDFSICCCIYNNLSIDDEIFKSARIIFIPFDELNEEKIDFVKKTFEKIEIKKEPYVKIIYKDSTVSDSVIKENVDDKNDLKIYFEKINNDSTENIISKTIKDFFEMKMDSSTENFSEIMEAILNNNFSLQDISKNKFLYPILCSQYNLPFNLTKKILFDLLSQPAINEKMNRTRPIDNYVSLNDTEEVEQALFVDGCSNQIYFSKNSYSIKDAIRETFINSIPHPKFNEIYQYSILNESSVSSLQTYYKPNSSLNSFLNEKNRIPISKMLNIMYDVKVGLRFLHQNNIIHRDVKPDNIFLDKQWNGYIGDFGYARIVDYDVLCTAYAGTPWYYSPTILKNFKRKEQSASLEFTSFNYMEYVDLNSLASTFMHALTDIPPYKRFFAFEQDRFLGTISDYQNVYPYIRISNDSESVKVSSDIYEKYIELWMYNDDENKLCIDKFDEILNMTEQEINDFYNILNRKSNFKRFYEKVKVDNSKNIEKQYFRFLVKFIQDSIENQYFPSKREDLVKKVGELIDESLDVLLEPLNDKDMNSELENYRKTVLNGKGNESEACPSLVNFRNEDINKNIDRFLKIIKISDNDKIKNILQNLYNESCVVKKYINEVVETKKLFRVQSHNQSGDNQSHVFINDYKIIKSYLKNKEKLDIDKNKDTLIENLVDQFCKEFGSDKNKESLIKNTMIIVECIRKEEFFNDFCFVFDGEIDPFMSKSKQNSFNDIGERFKELKQLEYKFVPPLSTYSTLYKEKYQNTETFICINYLTKFASNICKYIKRSDNEIYYFADIILYYRDSKTKLYIGGLYRMRKNYVSAISYQCASSLSRLIKNFRCENIEGIKIAPNTVEEVKEDDKINIIYLNEYRISNKIKDIMKNNKINELPFNNKYHFHEVIPADVILEYQGRESVIIRKNTTLEAFGVFSVAFQDPFKIMYNGEELYDITFNKSENGGNGNLFMQIHVGWDGTIELFVTVNIANIESDKTHIYTRTVAERTSKTEKIYIGTPNNYKEINVDLSKATFNGFSFA